MKRLVCAHLLSLVLIVVLVPSVCASVTVQATVDQDVVVTFNLENINSTIYWTIKDEQLITERKSFFRRLAEKKARAAKLWLGVSRQDKAAHLWQARKELWEQYHRMVKEDNELHPPILPTRKRILGAAQMAAYCVTGAPRIEIDTSIDYEVVWCMVKPQ